MKSSISLVCYYVFIIIPFNLFSFRTESINILSFLLKRRIVRSNGSMYK